MVVDQKTLDQINQLLAKDGLKAVFTPSGLVICSLGNKDGVNKETDSTDDICLFLDNNGLKLFADSVTGKVYIVSKASLNTNNQYPNRSSLSRARPTSIGNSLDPNQYSPPWFQPPPNLFMDRSFMFTPPKFTTYQCPYEPHFITDELINKLAGIKADVDRAKNTSHINPHNYASGWGGWQATAQQDTDAPFCRPEQFDEFIKSVLEILNKSKQQPEVRGDTNNTGGETQKPTTTETKPDDNAQPVWVFTGALEETILAVKKRIEVLNDLFTPGKYTDNLTDEVRSNVLRELRYLQVLLQCQIEQHEMLYGKTL